MFNTLGEPVAAGTSSAIVLSSDFNENSGSANNNNGNGRSGSTSSKKRKVDTGKNGHDSAAQQLVECVNQYVSFKTFF